MNKIIDNQWVTKVMQFFVIFVGLSGCIKLEEREVLLDNYCIECKQMLQDSLLNLPGIYFVEYINTSKAIKIKYEPQAFELKKIHDFLGSYGFMVMGDSINRRLNYDRPPCCK